MSPQKHLRPSRALLHPLWLLALIVLATNDHLLKGSGLLPGELTGKLSDFAGLLVAPALFAALLGLRRRGSVALAHVAVGVVFAALQLSATASALWSGLFDTLGVGWRTWSDPSDLLALPMLLVSWRVLVPTMARVSEQRDRHAAMRFAVASVGLVFCMGTSPPDENPPIGTFVPSQFTDVFLFNNTGEEFVVRVRNVKPSLTFDCTAVQADPGMLSEEAFGDGDTWTIPVDTILPVLQSTTRTQPCYALRVESDRMEPMVLFWNTRDFPMRTVQGSGENAGGAAGLGRGGVEIVAGNTFFMRNIDGDVAFEPRDASSTEVGPGCEAQPDSERLDWSQPVPAGTFTLTGVEPGFDGCLAVELMSSTEATTRWFVCMPLDAWPFNPGDTLNIAAESIGTAGVIVGEHNALFLERIAAAEPDGYSAVTLTLSRGAGVPSIAGATGTLSGLPGCASVPDACGTVATAGHLSMQLDSGDEISLQAGQNQLVERVDGSILEIFLVHAAQRPVVDTVCSEGSNTPGADIELVTLQRFLNP